MNTETLEIISTLIVTLTAFFALIYGLINVRKGPNGSFYSFCVLGFFGFAIGYLYAFLLEVTEADGMNFSLGSLGIISGFLNISFACSSVKKVDAIEVGNIVRQRLIALVVPVFFIACWLALLLGKVGFEKMIISTLLLFSAMPCAYFCFTNIIIPFPKKSILGCMRPFFVVVLIENAVVMLTELNWLLPAEGLPLIWSLFLVFVSEVCFILMPIFLQKGNKKWIQM